MQLHALTTLTLALFGGLAAAKCCKEGLDYCGTGLLNKGNYYGEIETALKNKGLPVDSDHVKYSLFRCISCTNTPVVKYCGGAGKCIDGGSGHSDFC